MNNFHELRESKTERIDLFSIRSDTVLLFYYDCGNILFALSSDLRASDNSMAACGLSLKYVHTHNPSDTAAAHWLSHWLTIPG